LNDNFLDVVNNLVNKLCHHTNFLVKKLEHFKEFIAKPYSSIEVGIDIVNINELSNSFLINIFNIKFKMFYLKFICNSSITSYYL